MESGALIEQLGAACRLEDAAAEGYVGADPRLPPLARSRLGARGGEHATSSSGAAKKAPNAIEAVKASRLLT